MKYLCLAYYDVEKSAALPKPQFDAIVSRCPQHDAELRASGRLVMSGSLGAPESWMAIRPREGRPAVTDGPYAETKELVGGFFIIEAQDLNDAVRVASKHPAAHLGEAIGWGVEILPIDTLMPV
ncbi:MAG TPA: YciI family protein [Casimicrobiaceae bacterium]|nr:YciI family protein [Casimicrobiaceae bacterium]